jgi:hypothetical protein
MLFVIHNLEHNQIGGSSDDIIVSRLTGPYVKSLKKTIGGDNKLGLEMATLLCCSIFGKLKDMLCLGIVLSYISLLYQHPTCSC